MKDPLDTQTIDMLGPDEDYTPWGNNVKLGDKFVSVSYYHQYMNAIRDKALERIMKTSQLNLEYYYNGLSSTTQKPPFKTYVQTRKENKPEEFPDVTASRWRTPLK